MLTALELANIIDKINSIIKGKDYYVTDIYPILNDTYIFKLHHAFENDILLVVSCMGIWITKYIIKEQLIPTPTFMVSLDRLKRCKLLYIKQLNNDRVLYLKFLDKIGKDEIVFYLIIELFNNGNIILCDSNMRIISLLKHNKRVHIGERYKIPLEDRLDPLKIEYEEFKLLFTSNIPVDRLLINNIALPRSIVEIIIDNAKIDGINEESLERLYYSLKSITKDIRDGKRSLIVSDTDNYLDALDNAFSNIIIDKLRHMEDNKNEELLRVIKANEEKKQELENKAKTIRALALRFSNNSITEFDLEEAKRLGIIYEDNPYSAASRLYNIAKRLEDSVRKIEKDILDNKEKLSKIEKTIKIKKSKDIRWFERYRWFITSDNLLAVGGKDAYSNSTLLNRYANGDDIIFHADINGSPFFILKERKEKSIEEVAIATASFSRAWKEGVNAIDVYYVNKRQLNPTNKAGSYTISGKRNYIKNVELRLGIGIINYNNNKYVVCAPVSSLSKCIIIKPGDKSKEKIARDIIDRLSNIDKDFIRTISVEEILKVLPNGKMDIL